jgi:hypothetical protein
VARGGVWVLLACEAVLIAVAQRDIQMRPAAERDRAGGLFRARTQGRAMSGATIGQVIVVLVVSAAAFSTGWVIRDAAARGIPRRKALVWAALQWVEFPLFLWLYRRARPKRRRRPKGDLRPGSSDARGT